MEEEKEVLRKRWHQEVDTIFDKLGSSISLMEESSLESIKTQQKTIKDTTQDMVQTVQHNKLVLKTNRMSLNTNQILISLITSLRILISLHRLCW